MSVLGIGVDVVHIPRIHALTSRRGTRRFASKILSNSELSFWKDKLAHQDTASLRFLAGRWAVKEAAYKALQPSFRPSWKELEYLATPTSQKPMLVFRPGYDKQFSGELLATLSHDGDYVFSTVLYRDE